MSENTPLIHIQAWTPCWTKALPPTLIHQQHDLSKFSTNLRCSGNTITQINRIFCLFVCFTQINELLEKKVAIIIDGYKCVLIETVVWNQNVCDGGLSAVAFTHRSKICTASWYLPAGIPYGSACIFWSTCASTDLHDTQRPSAPAIPAWWESFKTLILFLACMSIWSTHSMCY